MTYRFEGFEFDPQQFALKKGRETVSIEPQAVALLSYLIENRDRVVSKDELNENIWKGRIVSDSALSSRVKTLRHALDDNGKNQRCIKTIHGVGFRFVANLDQNETASVPERPVQTEADKPSVAILPFANLSNDKSQEYFSDGVTTDIITALSKFRWLNIIARNSTFGYKGHTKDVRRIGKELDADYVVDGAVQKAASRIRINVQLVDAKTGSQIWGERYDRNLEDMFAVQDDITTRISARLEPEIGLAERQKVVRAARRDLRAWDCYHLGVSNFFKFTEEGNLEAQRLLARARVLDPGFGDAHAWWAYAVILGMIYWETEPSPETMESAHNATCRAIEIDDQNAVYYALKARVQLARCEYQSAIVGNEMAIKLNPTFAAAHCGLADSLAFEGRYDEAIAGFEHALDLSPNDPQRWAFLTYGALALIFDKQFEKALEWLALAMEIPNKQYWTKAHRVVALALLGHREEAREAARDLLLERPDFSVSFVRKKLFYIRNSDQLDLYIKGVKLAGLPAVRQSS